MSRLKISDKSQITLPSDIRDAAHLEAGDYLDAELLQNGVIMLRPVRTQTLEPTREQETEILAAVDEARAAIAAERRR